MENINIKNGIKEQESVKSTEEIGNRSETPPAPSAGDAPGAGDAPVAGDAPETLPHEIVPGEAAPAETSAPADPAPAGTSAPAETSAPADPATAGTSATTETAAAAAETASATVSATAEAVARDPNFRLFVGDRGDRVPFVRLYADYLALCGGIREAERARAAAVFANTRANPGALAGQGPVAEPYYTREEVARMSPAEVHSHYARIRESMKKW